MPLTGHPYATCVRYQPVGAIVLIDPLTGLPCVQKFFSNHYSLSTSH